MITTEAGKWLHETDCWDRYPGENGADGCSCGQARAIAAIEAEAWEKGYGDGVIEAQRREVESIPDYRAKAIADERVRVREKLTNRLAPSEAAAILAIFLEEE